MSAEKTVISATVSGDAGARGFLRAHPELIDEVDCSDLSTGEDVDTTDQLGLLHSQPRWSGADAQEPFEGIFSGRQPAVEEVNGARPYPLRPVRWFPVLVFAGVVPACG